ncbi:glycosyltransferase family 2 protein [Paraflavitalea speifideaquila]|uniref:glycosyltransferase family 2 protein n=1 Tax=Paraflavitalea speifideaquila TaxID=3076558 RepID=UPI0028E1BC6B|nr:glycosyltransferase family 2 protein [Paraflavitalea speifideiaquila]
MSYAQLSPVAGTIPGAVVQFKPVLPTELKISAVIITYNEEKIIRKTLQKLSWCDEIVIVDSYSTDNTVAICQEFGCDVYSRTFDGYGSQKQYAIARATNDWVLCVDADEIPTDELVLEIRSISPDTAYAGFSFPMNLVFLDREFKHGKESGRHFLRLFNRQKGGVTNEQVHESFRVEGPVKKLEHTILHYSYTSIHQCIEKLNRYSTLSAGISYGKGKKIGNGCLVRPAF